jgi:hypothetical protein
MVTIELGKIRVALFGYGGYQDAQFGLTLEFEGKGWGVGTFIGPWARRTSGAKWTLDDQARQWAEMCAKLRDILEDAKKQHIGQLVGVPVEVTFEDRMLKDWRVLTEVM